MKVFSDQQNSLADKLLGWQKKKTYRNIEIGNYKVYFWRFSVDVILRLNIRIHIFFLTFLTFDVLYNDIQRPAKTSQQTNFCNVKKSFVEKYRKTDILNHTAHFYSFIICVLLGIFIDLKDH